jgi:hypothetical protein
MSTPPATAVHPAPTAPPTAPAAQRPAAAWEACPLCGASLQPGQEWCLRCGAAARTRLAPSPNWKGPLAVTAAVCALALGVLAGSLVKLAGDSGPAPAPVTHTVTRPAAVTPLPAPVPNTAATTTVPAPGAATTAPGATPTTTGGSNPASPSGGAAAPTPTTPGAAGTRSATPGTTTGGATKSKKLSPEAEKRLHELINKIG